MVWQQVIERINFKTADQPLIMLAPEAERGLGLEKLLDHYSVIAAGNDAVAGWFSNNNKGALVKIEGGSAKLAGSGEVIQFLKEKFSPKFGISSGFSTKKIWLQFFKNISNDDYPELTSAGYSVQTLNNTAKLTRELENKIKQFQILSNSEVKSYLPESIVSSLENVNLEEYKQKFSSRGIAVQLPFGHTGSSTHIVDDSEKGQETWQNLLKIRAEFPKRACRVVKKIEGHSFTINACIYKGRVYVGGLSYQFTGIPQLTSLSSATVGNDWKLPETLLTEENRHEIVKLTEIVGSMLDREFSFKGLFGIDLICEQDTGKIYLIEINPRQTASVAMHAKLQLERDEIPLSMINLCEFMGIDIDDLLPDTDTYNQDAIKPFSASQVFLRSQLSTSYIIPRTKLKSGVYRQQSDNTAREYEQLGKADDIIYLDSAKDRPLIRQGDGYSLDDFGNDGFLLLFKPEGSQVDFNEELARIQLRQSAAVVSENIIQLIPLVKDTFSKISSILL